MVRYKSILCSLHKSLNFTFSLLVYRLCARKYGGFDNLSVISNQLKSFSSILGSHYLTHRHRLRLPRFKFSMGTNYDKYILMPTASFRTKFLSALKAERHKEVLNLFEKTLEDKLRQSNSQGNRGVLQREGIALIDIAGVWRLGMADSTVYNLVIHLRNVMAHIGEGLLKKRLRGILEFSNMLKRGTRKISLVMGG